MRLALILALARIVQEHAAKGCVLRDDLTCQEPTKKEQSK